MNLLTLSEIQTFLRIAGTAPQQLQDLLTVLGNGAESWLEGFCGVAFAQEARTEEFPEYETRGLRFIWPRLLPLVSITKITDLTLGVDLTSSEYAVINNRKIIHKSGGQVDLWPDGLYRFSVQYTAGYNGSTDAPDAFKIAALTLIKKAYESPGVLSQNFQASSLSFESLAIQGDIKELVQPFRMQPAVE